jgi:hypothetical protein
MSTSTTIYPQSVECTLKLNLKVHSEEEMKYLFNEDGSLAISFIADVYDVLSDAQLLCELDKVQDLSYADIKKQMAATL